MDIALLNSVMTLNQHLPNCMLTYSHNRAFKELGKVGFWSTLGHAEPYSGLLTLVLMHVNSFRITGYHSIYCPNVEVRMYDNKTIDNNFLAN